VTRAGAVRRVIERDLMQIDLRTVPFSAVQRPAFIRGVKLYTL